MPEPKSSGRCGPHTELASNRAARITRCACGSIHVHLLRSGVSVQVNAAAFTDVAGAVAEAARELAAFDRAGDDEAAKTFAN